MLYVSLIKEVFEYLVGSSRQPGIITKHAHENTGFSQVVKDEHFQLKILVFFFLFLLKAYIVGTR